MVHPTSTTPCTSHPLHPPIPNRIKKQARLHNASSRSLRMHPAPTPSSLAHTILGTSRDNRREGRPVSRCEAYRWDWGATHGRGFFLCCSDVLDKGGLWLLHSMPSPRVLE